MTPRQTPSDEEPVKPVEDDLAEIAAQVNADPPSVADVPFALESEVARTRPVQDRLFS